MPHRSNGHSKGLQGVALSQQTGGPIDIYPNAERLAVTSTLGSPTTILSWMESNPWEAIGLSFLAGMAFMALFGLSRKD